MISKGKRKIKFIGVRRIKIVCQDGQYLHVIRVPPEWILFRICRQKAANCND